MSLTNPAHEDLAFSLTKHYFGESVASVIRILFNYDRASLHLIKSSLPEHNIVDIKRSLLILVKYKLVDFSKNHHFEYYVVPHRVFSFYRSPRFIQKCRGPGDKTIRLIRTIHLDVEQFNRKHRDDLIIDAIHTYYNKEIRIRSLCKTILDLSLHNTADDAAITAPIPITELLTALVPKEFADKNQLDQYLSKLTLENNNRFFLASGIHPNKGPMYALNLGLVLDYLVKEQLSSRVTSKFGPKCCRVFRVLLLRGPLLLKQIEEFIMLPARDVREYSYMLIKEGLIRNRQVPRTPDNAPGKSIFIMSVELDQVVYNTADICCMSMNHLLIRYEHELRQNKTLLDRSKAVRDLLKSSAENPDEAQDDWNQYFNSHELSQLSRINYTIDKILMAKNQVDETLFLFHSWLNIKPSLPGI